MNKSFNTKALFYALLLLVNTKLAASEDLQVAKVLDSFHQAAAQADAQQYFAQLHANAVFIGTDATERWNKATFRSFAEPYFSKGTGWTYVPHNRNISINSQKNVAWFDELLNNEKYGLCRGTGVLELTENGWKISQYHLTIPMPNDIAGDLVNIIRKSMVKGD